MSNLSPAALERIAAAENREKISPLLAFPGAAIRVRLKPNSLAKNSFDSYGKPIPFLVHDLMVEFSDLAAKKSEHVHHEMVTLPGQVRIGLVGTALVVSYREGDGNWKALFTREVATTDAELPVTEFDWR